ncbi:MAG: hypothetical protein ABS46_18090 [Cytophagaceae bacterium SCN 52-12]|nr:MAG: hypothetical protein ABS46_18090 [Cytophagaceae bacterium SCN 52-12]
MSHKDNITLIVATDNFYAILLGALIKSIEENHRTTEKIDLYIIDDGISKANREKLSQCATPSVTTLHWFKSHEVLPAGIRIPVDRSAFPVTTYLRLFAPYLIPADVRRFIYLDVDMIVLEDISKLWHTDLQGRLFGAVQDLSKTVGSGWGGIPNYEKFGFHPDDLYFNAGLLVGDPVRWREEDVSNRVIKALFDNLSDVDMADQYGLNVVLNNQWLPLDERWNAFSVLDIKDPYLIHFLDIKPIFKTYRANTAYREEFYKYLRLTPWKDFKPIGDYHRLARKAYNKLKKNILGFLK